MFRAFHPALVLRNSWVSYKCSKSLGCLNLHALQKLPEHLQAHGHTSLHSSCSEGVEVMNRVLDHNPTVYMYNIYIYMLCYISQNVVHKGTVSY